MAKDKEFTNDDAQDIANEVARDLIIKATKAAGNVAGIMTTLNVVQALVVKNCLMLMSDGMNMSRADMMIDLSSENSKSLVRSLSARVTN